MFVRQLTERCSGQELVALTSLLIEQYFCGTNILLTVLYEAAIVTFPHLTDFIGVQTMGAGLVVDINLTHHF